MNSSQASNSQPNELESTQIKDLFNSIKQDDNLVDVKYIPAIMRHMGQIVGKIREQELIKSAFQLSNNKIDNMIDVDTAIKIVITNWTDTKSAIENAIFNLDELKTGNIELETFCRVMTDYGEPLEKKELDELIEFLFGGNKSITCAHAIELFHNAIKLIDEAKNKDLIKSKEKKRKKNKKLNATKKKPYISSERKKDPSKFEAYKLSRKAANK